MAALPVNFKDDILAESMGGKRRYNIIQNDDGTISLEDVTTYTQEGSNFGAAVVNAIAQAIIDLQNQQVETVDPMLATEEGFAADAKLTGDAMQLLNENFSTGTNAIGDAIVALGVNVPEGTPLPDMATIILSSLAKKAASKDFIVVTSSQAPTNVNSYNFSFSSISSQKNGQAAFILENGYLVANQNCKVTFQYSFSSRIYEDNTDASKWSYLYLKKIAASNGAISTVSSAYILIVYNWGSFSGSVTLACAAGDKFYVSCYSEAKLQCNSAKINATIV